MTITSTWWICPYVYGCVTGRRYVESCIFNSQKWPVKTDLALESSDKKSRSKEGFLGSIFSFGWCVLSLKCPFPPRPANLSPVWDASHLCSVTHGLPWALFHLKVHSFHKEFLVAINEQNDFSADVQVFLCFGQAGVRLLIQTRVYSYFDTVWQALLLVAKLRQDSLGSHGLQHARFPCPLTISWSWPKFTSIESVSYPLPKAILIHNQEVGFSLSFKQDFTFPFMHVKRWIWFSCFHVTVDWIKVINPFYLTCKLTFLLDQFSCNFTYCFIFCSFIVYTHIHTWTHALIHLIVFIQ